MSINMTDVPYRLPKHKLIFRKGRFQIYVSIALLSRLTPEQRLQVLIHQAHKRPLIAIAYIHRLAKINDPLALKIAILYSQYQSYLEKSDTCFVENTKNLSADVKKLLEALLPTYHKTLMSSSVVILNEPQQVHIPDMQAKYKAFPDIIKHNDFYYLSFREAHTHTGKNDLGKVRILKGQKSDHQWNWQSVGLLESPVYDLRDPKFFIKGEGELRLMIGGSIPGRKGTKSMTPHVAYQFQERWKLEKAKVIPDNAPFGQWIWQVDWNHQKKAGYGFSYGINHYGTLHLMKSDDGVTFEKITEISHPFLTEATLRFKEDGTALALIRADPKTYIGNSSSDFKQWTLTEVPFHGGGHNFVFLKDKAIATTRHLFVNPDNVLEERMLIALLDQNQLIPLKTLKSQIDTGYAGIVVEEDNTLTIAYYFADNSEISNIYLTHIDFK